jgi:ankyrin repeat protein
MDDYSLQEITELDPVYDVIVAIVERKGKSQIRALLSELHNPNATSSHPVYGSVLAAAAGAGSAETIQYLLYKGADVNMKLWTGKHGSALCAAAASPYPENVKILLRDGAYVDLCLAQGEYGSALAAAVREGSSKNVRLLIQAGADVNMRLKAGLYGSALSAALPSIDNIQTLLNAGADVNMKLFEGPYGSALAAASATQVPKSLNALLEAGADVNMELSFGEFGSALVAAAAAPDELTSVMNIKTLLKAGANINMQVKDGKYGSALAAAASRPSSSPRVIETLINTGADINMQLPYGPYGSALAAAMSAKAASALLLAGADSNMKLMHGSFGSALSAALQRAISPLSGGPRSDTEEAKVVEVLLATGVDVGPLHQVLIEGLRIPDPVVRTGYGQAYEFKFDWELPLILKSSSDIESFLSHRGTLTRGKNTVKLASCREFLEKTFGDIGKSLLQGIVRALRSFQGTYCEQHAHCSYIDTDQ